MAYWLMKSEPSEFGIDDLEACGVEPWDGVRSYQARNLIRDEMKAGDRAFFYHSSCPVPGIVGIMEIASDAYPDPTAFDPADRHFDPASDPDHPRWYLVDVRFRRKLGRTIALPELKSCPGLAGLAVVRRGNRLSVMPVSKDEWDLILALE